MLGHRCRRWPSKATAAAPGFFLGRRDPGVTLATPHNVRSSGERLALKCKRSRLGAGAAGGGRTKSVADRIATCLPTTSTGVRSCVPADREAGERQARDRELVRRADVDAPIDGVAGVTLTHLSSPARERNLRPLHVGGRRSVRLKSEQLRFVFLGNARWGQLLHVKWGACCMEVFQCQTGSFWNARECSRSAPIGPPIQSRASITGRWQRTTGRCQSSRWPCGSPRRRTKWEPATNS